MNIEITTDNLSKSCRICLNEGELDIQGQTVSIMYDDVNDDENGETTRNVTPIELFQIYVNYENALLGLKDELKLLCCSCLNELSNCYIFYKKVELTNRKIQRFYEEAQKYEAEQQIQDETEDTLNNETEVVDDETEDAVDNETEVVDDETTTDNSIQDCIEQTYFIDKEGEEEQLLGDQSIDLNETVDTNTQAERDVIESFVDSSIIEEESADITQNILDSLHVQSDDIKKSYSKVSSGPRLLHEDGSLVLTQFLPSTAQVFEARHTISTTQDDDNDGGGGNEGVQFTTPDLSTVDYAAVEVKSSNLPQIIEQELFNQDSKSSGTADMLHTLDNYVNKEHTQGTANTVYICKYCPQAFAAPHYLIAHVRKSHVCKYCTEAFVKSMDLFVHIRQAHHQHKCAICNKELSSHSNLRGHIKRVHGIRLPAQVTLLDYRPPNINIVEAEKSLDKTLDETDMYF